MKASLRRSAKGSKGSTGAALKGSTEFAQVSPKGSKGSAVLKSPARAHAHAGGHSRLMLPLARKPRRGTQEHPLNCNNSIVQREQCGLLPLTLPLTDTPCRRLPDAQPLQRSHRVTLEVIRMSSKTATVETLTAAVQVLMVGSRQVTMSVYGQLDWVGLDEIDPFGRVAPRKVEAGYVYVIGRHAQSGALVRSCVHGDPRDSAAEIERHEADLKDKLARARGKADRWSSGIMMSTKNSDATAAFWRTAERQLSAELDEWTKTGAAKSAEWCSLPLIVLAGLR